MHNKLRDENPEKYEMMVKHRQEIFEKYFNCDFKETEWFKIIEK